MRVSRCLLIAALAPAFFLAGCSRNLVNQAQQFELHGKFASALVTYQQALARIPERDTRQRSDILMRIGECLYRMDRIPEAFSSFQKAAEADDSNGMAHLRMGEMFLSAGAPDRAREQATLVLNRMARNNEALALLGAAWAAADNPAMAKQAYERVLAADPKRITVAVALADIYNREEDVTRAREILKQASISQPGSALPWLATARLEEQEGNGTAAEEAYRRAVVAEDTPETNLRLAQFLQRAARIAEAEQVLRRVDAQRHDHPTYLGDFQLGAGHAGSALEQYRAVLETTTLQLPRLSLWQRLRNSARRVNLTSVRGSDQASVAARVIEAEIVAASGHSGTERTSTLNAIRKHLDEFRSALDPATTAVLETEMALADNNLAIARLFAASAIDLAPNSAASHYVAGLVDAAAGNEDSAQTEWQAALDNDPRYSPARLAIAEQAIERHDGEQADVNSREVVRDDPGNFRALIVFSRALILQGKPTAAAVMAHRAAVLDPSSVEPYLLMGEVALKLDRVPEALLNFERAVVAHPDSEEAMEGLLSVYRRGRVSYVALQKMEKAGTEAPVSSTLLEIAGRLYADHGWYTDAIRAMGKAIAVDPKRATAARILAQLQLSTGDLSRANDAAAHAGGNSEILLAAYRAQESGDWQKAISTYERALREGDQSGVAANNLAWLYAEHFMQLDRALEFAGAAAKLSPNNPAVLDTLGFVMLQRREYSSAVKILETAARLASSTTPPLQREVTAQIRKHLSDAYFSSGQTEAASQIAQNRGLPR
jgi:tetratricopeptide (TPR) repeat protein